MPMSMSTLYLIVKQLSIMIIQSKCFKEKSLDVSTFIYSSNHIFTTISII